ncbi:MAG: glycosyltransferase family 39 protein [Candidatus Scalindua sp.]|nr:glycosyltransferase family 39 protein [Candidatus Scalindua sp.]
MQIVFLSLGATSFAWAFIDQRFRDTEGFLDGGFCLPVSIGISLIIYGCAISGRLKRAAFWFALAIVGQAVSLQLIDAGPFVRYQHYKSFHNILTETNPILLFFLSAQTILVMMGFRVIWSNIKAWFTSNFKKWQILGIGLIFILFSATVSREKSAYFAELPFAAFIQTINLGTIILMMWHFPDGTLVSLRRKLDNLLMRSENDGDSFCIDRFVIIAALWVTSLAVILSIFSYERHPHIADEVGYLLHAKYFANGMLTMPAPPVQEAFNIDLMQYEADRWYSPVPPGWPAILSLGVIIGAPWIVNPILAGINVLLAYTLIRALYDRNTARISILLLSVSPWYLFMSMNFLTHTFTLTCSLVGAVAVIRARRTGKILWGCIGGIAVGMLFQVRPLDGLVIASLLGLSVIGIIGGKRLKITSIGAFALGAIFLGLVALSYNNHLTGNPLKNPINAYADKVFRPNANALGFGPDRGLDTSEGWAHDPFPGHGLLDVLVNSNLNTFSVNIELFGWSTGSLILMALMFFSGRKRKSDYLMITVIVLIVGTYSLYWFSGGPDFSARYWYLTIIPCVVLTVRGIHVLTDKIRLDSERTINDSSIVVLGVLLVISLTLINFFPWRAIDKYHHYRGMRPDIRHLANEYGFGKSIVLIRGDRHPDYASAATYNPVNLHECVPVYAWNRNTEVRAQVLKVYHDRPVWFVDGPSITNNGFKVIAGPLSVSEIIAKDNGK